MHKHAEVFRAIADGVPLSEFEVQAESWPAIDWENMSGDENYTEWIFNPDKWKVRRKPQYIMVNGFKVPKPLDVMPEGRAFTPDFVNESLSESWAAADLKQRLVKHGVAHLTKEAAIAHAKAMLGIDPEWSE